MRFTPAKCASGRELAEGTAGIFGHDQSQKEKANASLIFRLYQPIGQLEVESNFMENALGRRPPVPENRLLPSAYTCRSPAAFLRYLHAIIEEKNGIRISMEAKTPSVPTKLQTIRRRPGYLTRSMQELLEESC
jgi:hypothetical protein